MIRLAPLALAWAMSSAGSCLATDREHAFDHSLLDQVLQACVVGQSVDYQIARDNQPKLKQYVESLATPEASSLTGAHRMALFINAYNAATLLLIVEYWTPQLSSIMDIPEDRRWKDHRWNVGGKTYSLDEMEHQVLRAEYEDARIHAAVNCASVGCPPLRGRAFLAENLDEQLDQQTRSFVNNTRHIRVENEVLHVSAIFDWFKTDFEMSYGGVVAFLLKFAEKDLANAIKALGPKPTIRFLEYDWKLNAKPDA